MAAKAPAARARAARPAAIVIEEPERTGFHRRALPWLAALSFHAVVLAVSVSVVFEGREAPLPPRPVEVTLDAGSSEVSGDGSTPGERPASSSLRLPLPTPGARAIHPGRVVASADLRPRMQPIGAPRARDTGNVPQPSAQDVLADLPSASPAGPLPEGQLGWEEGAVRQVLVRREPQFPRTLAASGVEVECAARITVSPQGAVTHVEITRSSGYTEIDATVEAALREFLFSRVDGRKDAVGTITFRFRLEKRD